MKSLRVMIVLSILISSAAWARDNRILEVDPYSVSSVEKLFPNAVQTETIIDQGPRDYKKKIGPKTKELKTINYEALVPALIEVIQEQQKEIARLKDSN